MEAGGIFGRLRKEKFGVLHGALEEGADEEFPLFEAGEGFFGDAGVGENDRDLGAVGFAKEIWPDFCFHDDDERRLDRAEGAAHRNHPIERKIEDAVGGLQAFAGQALAGFGGGGDENYCAGIAAFQAVN